LFDARRGYEAWLVCVGQEYQKKYPRFYSQHKNFLKYSGTAYFSNMIVNLYKLYDSRSDNEGKPLSIPILINDAKKSGLVSNDNLEKIKNKKKKAEEVWKKVKILRNNLIAHRCRSLTSNFIYRCAKIRLYELEQATDLNLWILNTICSGLGFKKRYFDVQFFKDMIRILDVLSRTAGEV